MKALIQAHQYQLRLIASGEFEDGSEDLSEAVNAFLVEPSKLKCRCGRILRRFETDGKMCETCILAEEAAKEELSESQRDVMQRLGVPPRYRDMTKGSWEGSLPDEVARWMTRPDRDLVICGPDTGTGKTHLATLALYSVALARRDTDSGRLHAYWAHASDLATKLSDEKFDPSHPTFTKSTKVGILLIDDLGSEVRVTPSATQDVSHLIEERWRQKRPMVVTTNLSPERLVEYDPRVASRILAGYLVERSGQDRRW